MIEFENCAILSECIHKGKIGRLLTTNSEIVFEARDKKSGDWSNVYRARLQDLKWISSVSSMGRHPQTNYLLHFAGKAGMDYIEYFSVPQASGTDLSAMLRFTEYLDLRNLDSSNAFDQEVTFTCQVVDATGWAPQVGAVVDLDLTETGLQLISTSMNGTARTSEVAYSDITKVDVEGFSKTTGAQVFGGGFGIQGAIEGMAAAAILNSLTTRSSNWVVVTIEARTGRAVLLIDGASEQEVKKYLRRARDAVLAASDSTVAVPSSAPDNSTDIVTRLERLSALFERGVLSDSEFAEAKGKLIQGRVDSPEQDPDT